jgi:hypothetical protein
LTRESSTTIAILGGNTVAGLAMSFLLGDVGYETIILKAPPTGAEELLRDVNLLLVAPGLREEQRKASLAILRGTEEGLRVPVFAFSSAVEASVFAEDAGSSWPVAIGNLAELPVCLVERGLIPGPGNWQCDRAMA